MNKQCKNPECHETFNATHGNMKYCPRCRGQMREQYMRTYREVNREANREYIKKYMQNYREIGYFNIANPKNR